MAYPPMIGIDTNPKECLELLDHARKVLCHEAPQVLDYDYSYLSEGKMIPQGIDDVKAHRSYLTIGTSKENAGFIADNLIGWWELRQNRCILKRHIESFLGRQGE